MRNWMPMGRWAIVAAAVSLMACGSSSSSSGSATTSTTPPATGVPSPGNVNCPDGKQPQPGLTRFGSFIGTWQALNHQDPKATASYAAARIPGHVGIRCSNDNHLIVEQLYLDQPTTADKALALAVAELPEDAKQLYDHPHPSCRTLQYQSQQLAKELGPDDPQGVIGIELLNATSATYDPSAVGLAILDLLDAPGEDTNGC